MKIKMYTMFTPTSPSGKRMKSPQSAIQIFDKLQKTHILWLLVLFGLLNTSIVSAQVPSTVILTEDFESGTQPTNQYPTPTPTSSGWRYYNNNYQAPTDSDRWYVGSQTVGTYTSKMAYVAPYNLTTRAYRTYTAGGAGYTEGRLLYKKVTVPANRTSMSLSFRVSMTGNSTDNMYVAMVPVAKIDSNIPSSVGNQTLKIGATYAYKFSSPLANSSYGNFMYYSIINPNMASTTTVHYNKYITPTPAKSNLLAAGDYYLVFIFFSDEIGPSDNPPPAIDDIVLTGSDHRFISIKSGNWSDPTVWNTGTVPTSTDDVLVSAGHTVALTANITPNGQTITSNGSGTGDVTTKTTITVEGTLNTNNYVISGTGNLTVSSGGTLQVQQATGLAGAVTLTGTTTFASGSTLELNGTVAQSVAALNHTNVNVKVNNTLGVTATGAFNVASISVEAGKIFNAGALTHTLSGANGAAWTNSGTANMGTSTLVFTGAAGTITGATDFYNLTLNSGASTTISSGASKVNNILIVNGALTANGLLTLVSTASINSRVGASTGSATGVKVQRYIAMGRRAFRFLTPGVTTTTPISSNWQLGTHITGSTTGANGFDQTASGNPSLFVYNNQVASGTGWSSVPNTNATTLTSGVGYRLLLRGDRHDPLVIVNVTGLDMNAAVTLEATGSLTTGTVTMNASSVPPINNTNNTTTNGFSLVGNPYMSPVNWELVTKSGLEQSYYTWEADMGSAVQRGRYVAYNGTSHANSGGGSSLTKDIQPNQAFFVKNSTLGTAGTLTFNESNKTTSFNTSIFRTGAAYPSIDLSLYEPSEIALGGRAIDGARAVFSTDFGNHIDAGDAVKLESPGENLAWFTATKKLAIDARMPVVDADVLAIKTLRLVANKDYTFKIKSDYTPNVTGYLVDNYLNTQQVIDFTQDYFANFSTTTDAQSLNEDRFKIVFSSALNNNQFTKDTFVVYPNPVVNNHFTIKLPATLSGKVKVTLHNLLGQEVFEVSTLATSAIEITPKNTLSSGVYIVSVMGEGISSQQKITVQ